MNNLTNIDITDFNLQGNRLRCNLSANGTILDFSSMQVTDVTAISGVVGLQYLDFDSNQIAIFNPTIALTSSLQTLYLTGNQITTAGYTTMETWANLQPSFTNTCTIDFIANIDSVSGTNLEAILISKDCIVNF